MARHKLGADDADAIQIKRAIVTELLRTMQDRQITKAEMARRLRTSRAYLDRVLSLKTTTLSLGIIVKAFAVLGKSVSLTTQ